MAEAEQILLQVILVCTAAASWLSIVYKSDHRTSADDFDVLYDKPWVRISPYLIGLAGGVAVWAIKTKCVQLVTLNKFRMLWTLTYKVCRRNNVQMYNNNNAVNQIMSQLIND